MAAVRLSNAQRDAIRDEIRVVSTGCSDIPLSIEADRDGNTDRAFVVRKISELQHWVAVLDAIGWEESSDGDMAVEVTSEMAMWALGAFAEVEYCYQVDGHPTNPGRALAVISGLRAMAEVA